MAVNRKYADLPDLDAAPEIYETPELTDDASTVQTNTIRTESPTPSEDGKPTDNFDRARLNQEEARRRFEPAVVNAKSVNLSDAIGGNRRGYITSHRRRRRRRLQQYRGEREEYEDFSDLSSSEEEETLAKKLARLRREAEEVRLELERRDAGVDEGDFKDSVEQQGDEDQQEDTKLLHDGVEQLNQILNGLKVGTNSPKEETLEQAFHRQLDFDSSHHKNPVKAKASGSADGPISTQTAPSSISAIAAFSDRLTALEMALGLSPTSLNSNPSSIIPSLDNLTTQLSSLYTVISPHMGPTNAQRDHLETLTNRLHVLHVDADKMLSTRKAALQALTQLYEARYSGSNHNSAVFAKYLSRREARERYEHDSDIEGRQERSRSKAKDAGEGTGNRLSAGGAVGGGSTADVDIPNAEDRLFSEIFLEEQSAKITALYNTLPTIESLQPLLPVVLERLRGLSVVHASASSAQQDMSNLETRLNEWEKDVEKWRSAVINVEQGIQESKTIMKENVDYVGGIVGELEKKMDQLQRKSR